MTNVCPQQACLNRQTWEAMEKVESETYAQNFPSIWTITGPIFDSSPDTINCQVEVPKAFYKIIVRIDNGNPVILPMIMSQDTLGSHKIREFVTTVDDIEQQTGLDFFPDLPTDVQNTVEAAKPDDSWGLDTQLVPHFGCPAH